MSNTDVLRAIIVDDERAAIESLKLMLERFCDDVEVVATASSAKKGVKIINDNQADVVFLDIMMPDGTGFDILEKMPDRNFEVVFTTAYNELEIKAIKYSAIKFIQKPIGRDMLIDAVEKIKSRKGIVINSTKRYGTLFENLQAVLPRILSLPTENSYEFLEIEKILAIEGDNKEVVLTIDGESPLCAKEGIDHLDDILSERKFYRFSSSLLVNVANITSVDERTITLKDGKIYSIHPTRLSEFVRTSGNPPYH